MIETTKSEAERKAVSRDTSLFQVMPAEVAYPKDAAELAELVKEIAEKKKSLDSARDGSGLSITARAAGTDMGGGPLNTGVIAVLTKYMNHMGEVTVGSMQGTRKCDYRAWRLLSRL